jgi:hypothetical protein
MLPALTSRARRLPAVKTGEETSPEHGSGCNNQSAGYTAFLAVGYCMDASTEVAAEFAACRSISLQPN